MAKRQMVINYVAGEECRVAVIEDGKLEEFHSERAEAVSHVGNIYLGTVVNVEPAIQAAFVDFGLEQSGFLHVSDLHPQYFPGEDEETTERVGKKTPRRERPPIQQCLRRGQEIAVQVLKEGVGTKGPTLTSYLSIPGRFLVMMPQMDKVGVSRKVEDEETRRQMREILDQLDLPEGFGFILRTAGLDRTKLEIKRDLAYLLRLWKDIEKRWKKGARPRLLYSESDLLVRSLRDMLATDIDRIVIDNESALKRAARFLKIVAPRSAAGLVQYTGKTPLFHAMGIEPQIRNIHAREVPLPSGGRLVIDETEALVAIDVNSGKSREARDAETNAYETNLEAADEICRQLRLRDLGGIVVNDLIDMRSAKHRREIENRFKDLLKKDRARSTVAAISPFGILEMTRQRMRGSQESMHFAGCPICRGRGLVQKPDSVADDATRELATLLEYPRVARVQMVVAPRLAGELLSSKRHTLSRLERVSGKKVEVRVSEAVPVDRVSFYAYDDRGADIDTARLPAPKVDEKQLTFWEQPAAAEAADDWAVDPEQEAAVAIAAEEAPEPADAGVPDMLGDEDFDEVEGGQFTPTATPGGKKKRRRRRRRGGNGEGGENGHANGHAGGAGRPDGERRESGRQQPQEQQRRDSGRQQEPSRQGPARQEREEQGRREERRPAAAAAAGSAQGGDRGGDRAGQAEGQGVPHGDGNGEGGRRRRRRRRGRGGRDGDQQHAHPVEGQGETVLRRVGPDDEHGAELPPRGEGDEAEPPRITEVLEPAGEGHEIAAENGTIDAGHDERERVGAGGVSNGVLNAEAGEGEGEGGPKRRRRRRRGGRDRAGEHDAEAQTEAPAAEAAAAPVPAAKAPKPKAEPAPKVAAKEGPKASPADEGHGEGEEAPAAPRGRGRRSRGGRAGGAEKGKEPQPAAPKPPASKQPAPKPPATTKQPAAPAKSAPQPKPAAAPKGAVEPKAAAAPAKPRTLYAFRRKLSASERNRINPDK